MAGLGFLIGLTGALAPGPTLVATIKASLKSGWSAGPRVTLGHIVVEILMVLLIIAGMSVVIGQYSRLIAAIGGAALFVFGVLTLREAKNARIDCDDERIPLRSHLWRGSSPVFRTRISGSGGSP